MKLYKSTVWNKVMMAAIAGAMCILMLWSGTDHALAASGGWGTTSYSIKSSDGITIKFETLTNSGDATLLTITQGSTKKFVLVDTGKQAANVAGKLSNKGIKKINTVIITHNDGDHINGLKNFSKYGIKITNFYYNYDNSKAYKENNNFDALAYIKSIKSTVITGKATRIRDAQNHSGTTYNVNMETDSKEYLRICRGRLYKLSKMSGNNGYDLVIFPAITDNGWTINNKSMMVVVQTASDRVILGGDIQGTASQAINNYENSSLIKKAPTDAYSYYYGVKNYLFDSEANKRYITYKVSHHGTGTNRHVNASPNIIEVERTFFQNLNPNALVLTGYDSTKADGEYFKLICSKAARYTVFANKKL